MVEWRAYTSLPLFFFNADLELNHKCKFDRDSEKRSATKKACEDRRTEEAAGDVLKTVMVSGDTVPV
jgi:hypothetical protein